MAMYLQGWAGYVPMKSIITGFSVETRGGVQFMHTLRDFIYIYIFGERMAPLTIQGASFAHVCERMDETIYNSLGQTTFLPNYHGLEYEMGYYNAYRVTSTGAPVTIVLGISTVLYGFLTGNSVQLQDADHQLATFTLQFQALPQASLLG